MSIKIDGIEMSFDFKTADAIKKAKELKTELSGIFKGTAQSAEASSDDAENSFKKQADAIKEIIEPIKKMKSEMKESATEQKAQLKAVTDGLKEQMGQFKEMVQAINAQGSKINFGAPKISKDLNSMVAEYKAKMQQIEALTAKKAALEGSKGQGGDDIAIDEKIANVNAKLVSFQNQTKAMEQSVDSALSAIPTRLKQIAEEMDANEPKLEQMRKSIAQLNEDRSYQKEGGASWNKTTQQIEKQKAAFDKLVAVQDKLQEEYSQTERSQPDLKAAKSAMNGETVQVKSTGIDETKSKLERLMAAFRRSRTSGEETGKGVSRGAVVGQKALEKLRATGSKLGDSMKSIGSKFQQSASKFVPGASLMKRGLSDTTNGLDKLTNKLVGMVKKVFIFSIILKGLRAMRDGLMSNLKTNDQFSASLNQIKVNLQTAFYPIYNAILPAVNALMSAIASLTGQLASLIATLFGTSYQAAKAGAAGLQEQVNAMNDTGDAATKAKEKADKLKKSLAGFDELNILASPTSDSDDSSSDSASDAASGADFGAAMGDYTTPKWMSDLVEDIKDIAKRLLDPLMDAWNNKGQALIDAIKYAFTEIWGLIKSIGESFMTVWENGSGQRLVENILQLWTDIFNIIGDVAKAFKDAWNDDDRGTKMIQMIFDALNSVLELLHDIASDFRKAWNDGTGQQIAANLIELYTNLAEIIKNLADSFKKAWNDDNAGLNAWNKILDAVESVSRLVKDIAKSFADAFKSDVAVNIFNDLIKIGGNLFDIAGGLADQFDKAWTHGENGTKLLVSILDCFTPITDALEKITGATAEWAHNLDLEPQLQSLKTMFEGLKSAISPVLDVLVAIYEKAILPLAKVLMESTLPSIIEAIGSAFGAMGAIFELIKPLFMWIIDILGNTLQQALKDIKPLIEGVTKALDDIKSAFEKFKAGDILGGFDDLGRALVDIVAGAFEGVWNLLKNIGNTLKDLFEPVLTAFGKVPGWIKEKLTDLANGIFEFIFGPKVSADDGHKATTYMEDLASFFKELPAKIKSAIGDVWEGIKGAFNFTKDKVLAVCSGLWNWAGDVIGNIKDKLGDVLGAITEKFGDLKASVTQTVNQVRGKVDAAINAAKDLAQKVNQAVGKVAAGLKKNFGDLKQKVNQIKGTVAKALTTALSTLKQKVNQALGSKAGALKAIGALAQKVNQVRGTVAKALTTGLKAVTQKVNLVLNGAVTIGKQIADAIKSAINTATAKLTWPKVMPFGLGGKRIIPAFAKGTMGHKGGQALVNDGKTGKWREAWRMPGGKWKLFPNIRDLLVNLPKGAQVLDGDNTANLYPHFATGTSMAMPSALSDLASDMNNPSPMTPNMSGVNQSGNNQVVQVLQSILAALLGGSGRREENGDIVINIGGTQLVRILAKQIKQYEKMTGQTIISMN